MNVLLPDGNRLELPEGATGHDAAAAIGPGLAKAALAVRVGDEVRDLARPLADGEEIAIVTAKSGDDHLYVMRHSAAHVMAEAVMSLFPGTRFGFGPPIADGFYYDFELPEGARFTEDDLERIEARMRELVKADQTFVREECSFEEGMALFADQPYKLEIIGKVSSGEAD